MPPLHRERETSTNATGMTTISVIIPTHNRGQSLARTIQSALLLDYPRDQFEIIVVDNASTDHTEALVRDVQARNAGPELQYVAEPNLGLHHARHAGFRRSKGELLLFTDDDATFSAGWLHAYAAAFADQPDMEAAGGPVRPAWDKPPPRWLVEFIDDQPSFPYLSLMEPHQEFRMGADCYFFGVNMAVRRRVFEWTGFHPELVGAHTIGDGESGLLTDIVHKMDWKIGYVPGALVYHHIPPRRMTLGYIRTWAHHLGGSLMFQRWWRKRRPLYQLLGEVFVIAREHAGAWLKAPWLRRRRDWEAILVMFQASLGWAKLRYLWWMLTDPQVKAALDTESFKP